MIVPNMSQFSPGITQRGWGRSQKKKSKEGLCPSLIWRFSELNGTYLISLIIAPLRSGHPVPWSNETASERKSSVYSFHQLPTHLQSRITFPFRKTKASQFLRLYDVWKLRIPPCHLLIT